MMRVVSTSAGLALAAVLATALLAGCGGSPAAPGGQPGIVAHGEGKVTGSPDTVTVALGVQTRGPSAKGALDANTARANALISVLRGRGVADRDLQTSELSITPVYGPEGDGRITGYQVSNQVTATVRDVGLAGAIIDAAAEAAGDAVRVQQLGFSISDDSRLRAAARSAAVRQAQEKAKQLAEAAGVSLGDIFSITESPGAAPVPYNQATPRGAAADVPIQPGSQELLVAVDIVYATN